MTNVILDDIHMTGDPWQNLSRYDPKPKLGNEVSADRTFEGIIYQATLWKRKLSEADISVVNAVGIYSTCESYRDESMYQVLLF